MEPLELSTWNLVVKCNSCCFVVVAKRLELCSYSINSEFKSINSIHLLLVREGNITEKEYFQLMYWLRI